MIKQLNKFLSLLFLTLGSSLLAVPPVLEPTNPTSIPTNALACNLPPPSFFSMLSAGTTWITLTWSPVASATAYHIITKEVATGNVVDNSMVPASMNSLTINNLPPDTAYESWIWSVCSNGQDGSDYNYASSNTIVIDVVTLGYPDPPECLQDDCTLEGIGPGNGCDFPWGSNATTYFRIAKKSGGAERYFMVTADGTQVDLYPDDDTNNDIQFFKGDDGKFARIRCAGYLGSIARVSAAHHAVLYGKLFREEASDNHADFEIVSLVACPEGRPGNPITWDTNPLRIAPAASVVVSPNPFSDHMDVYVAFPGNTEQITLRLHDTQGRVVVSHQAPAELEQYSLPTAVLPPGVYFLRVESAGQTQTIKVVKTR